MEKSLFEYLSYRDFLKDWIESRPGRGRGEKLRFSKAVGCHSAYVTFVLSGRADFTLEQGEALSRYLGLDSEETHFFFLQIQLARAGTFELKKHFQLQIKQFLERRSHLKNRLKFEGVLSPEHRSVYYSSWHFSAIHMAVSAEGFETRESLAKYFQLPLPRVSEVLKFLVLCGLVVSKGSRYKIGLKSIHLGNDSSMIVKHHTNWRIKAIQSLDREDEQSLHYSSVVMMSPQDLPAVRSVLVKAIEQVRKIIAKSPEEHCYSYSLDLFRVGVQSDKF